MLFLWWSLSCVAAGVGMTLGWIGESPEHGGARGWKRIAITCGMGMFFGVFWPVMIFFGLITGEW